MHTFLRRLGYWKAIFLVFPLAAFLAFSKPIEPKYDYWEHAATVRALAQDLRHPSNPFMDFPGTTSPRFVPYTVLLGVIARISHLDIFTLMAMGALVNYLLFALGLYLLVRSLYQDPRMPLYVLLICWLFWGRGWDHSNGYQFEIFLVGLTDPYMFSYALSFFALYFLVVFLRLGSWWAFVASISGVAVNFVNHPPTAAYCLIFAFAIVVTTNKSMVVRRGIPYLFLAGVAIVTAAKFWPYFSYSDTFFHGLRDKWYKAQLYSDLVNGLGPALLGFPVLVQQALQRQHRLILVGFSLSLLMYGAGFYAGIEMGERFVFFAAFFLHLAIATYLCESGLLSRQGFRQWLSHIRLVKNDSSRRESQLFVMVIAFLFVWAVISRGQALSMHLSRVLDLSPKIVLHAYESPVEKYLVLDKYLDSSDVALSDLMTSWMVPAITGAKVVAVFHNNPLLGTENTERKAAIEAFFDPASSFTQRWEILRRYRVSRVVANFDFTSIKRGELVSLMDGLGTLLADENGMMIFQVEAETRTLSDVRNLQ